MFIDDYFLLTLESTLPLKIVLSKVTFHNSVASLVYAEIIFHVELNISVVSLVNISVQSVLSMIKLHEARTLENGFLT